MSLNVQIPLQMNQKLFNFEQTRKPEKLNDYNLQN